MPCKIYIKFGDHSLHHVQDLRGEKSKWFLMKPQKHHVQVDFGAWKSPELGDADLPSTATKLEESISSRICLRIFFSAS